MTHSPDQDSSTSPRNETVDFGTALLLPFPPSHLMRHFLLTLALLILIVPYPPETSAQWNTNRRVDETTSQFYYEASSPLVAPSDDDLNLYFARLVVICDTDGLQSPYIWFLRHPRFTHLRYRDDRPPFVRVRAYFDQELKWLDITENLDGTFLPVAPAGDGGLEVLMIDWIETASTLVVEVPWRGRGIVRYRFSLAGSSQALRIMRSNCRS